MIPLCLLTLLTNWLITDSVKTQTDKIESFNNFQPVYIPEEYSTNARFLISKPSQGF